VDIRKIQRLAVAAHRLDLAGRYADADRIDSYLLKLAINPNDEFFYTDSGQLHYANGDIGDVNHDMLAEEHLLGTLGWDISESDEYPLTLTEANSTWQKLQSKRLEAEEYDEYHEQMKDREGENYDEYNHEVLDYLRWKAMQRAPEDPQAAESHRQSTDDAIYYLQKNPTMHVIKAHGWIRISGKYVDVASISDHKRIAAALKEAYDPEPTDAFTINDYSGGMYENVPFWAIEEGKIKDWETLQASRGNVGDLPAKWQAKIRPLLRSGD
jgi:hypothetical protein